MKYAIIGDEDTILGFGIVGVSGAMAGNAEEAHRAFQMFIKDKDVAVLIITERIADWIRPLVDRYLFTMHFPLIVEIPDRHGPKPGRRSIKEMVNTAIGIKV